MAANYDVVTLQNWHADMAQSIKALNPRVKVFFYRAAHQTWDWQENWGEINAHESWFLHSSAGQRVRNSDPNDPYYVMDLGNAEFRAYQIGYIMKFINTYGFDGLMWDGPPSVLEGWLNLSPGPTSQAAAAWHQYVLTMLHETKQALGSRLLITNSTPIYDVIANGIPGADDSDYLAYVDGTALEGFGHAPWEPYTTTPGAATWAWQQRMAERNLSAGKNLYVAGGVDYQGALTAQVNHWQIFTLASYLLKADGAHAYYEWAAPGQQNPIFPEMTVSLGTPLGPAYLSNGIWQRDFTGGKILVNASDSSLQTTSLPAGLHTLDASIVVTDTTTLVKLDPWTAVLLWK